MLLFAPPQVGVPTTESNFARIGNYRMYSWGNGDDFGRVTVLDRKGKIVARIDSNHKATFQRYGDLDGDGHRDMLIKTWTGGAHASFDYYVLSFWPKPHCLLAFDKGNGEGAPDGAGTYTGDLEIHDLDGDGRPELVSWYDGFAYTLGAGYAPAYVPQILKLRHGRYVEATDRFPTFLRKSSRKGWSRLLSKDDDRPSARRVFAIEFLAPKIILGEEAQGWHLLRKVMAANEYADLYRNRRWIERVVAQRRTRVRTPSLRSIQNPHPRDRYDSSPWL